LESPILLFHRTSVSERERLLERVRLRPFKNQTDSVQRVPVELLKRVVLAGFYFIRLISILLTSQIDSVEELEVSER
jgi:hypothetical protein